MYLQGSQGGSGLHLSPFKHQSICPTQKQSLQHSSKEHSTIVKEKVLKLKRDRAIKEVFYPEWLAKMVVVKKKSGK